MIEADSVLCTPPLNSSSIHNANSPPEARAESVDSLAHQPATGQPESRNLTGESGKPAKGLSRRAALGGLAALPAAGAATMPASASHCSPIVFRTAYRRTNQAKRGAAAE